MLKKSEYLKQREEFWREKAGTWGLGGFAPKGEVIRAGLDADAAEAAGVVWDPEEEPLPERLEITAVMNGSKVKAVGDGDYPWVAAAEFNYRGESGTKSAHAVLAEMVRRYNAWPELERLAEELHQEAVVSPADAATRMHAVRPAVRALKGALESGK